MQHTGPMQTVSSISGVTGMSFAAVGVHTAAMFLIMAAVALVVYEYVGLAVLRRAWFNLDRVWASALIVAGVVSLLVT
jgi:hypothetical protein